MAVKKERSIMLEKRGQDRAVVSAVGKERSTKTGMGGTGLWWQQQRESNVAQGKEGGTVAAAVAPGEEEQICAAYCEDRRGWDGSRYPRIFSIR